jgi:signal transduction histidine kinase
MQTAIIVERYHTLQRYIGWENEDAQRVQAAQSILLPHLEPVIDDFYTTIEQFPEALKVITGGPAQILRLKQKLLDWVRELLHGPYERDYILRRRKVGYRHVEIGLDQMYADAALSRMRGSLVALLEQNWTGTQAELRITLSSFRKLLDLEFAIIASAYQAEYLLKLNRSERFAALGQVTGGIAHEMRNPLNVIKTSVYYLLNARSATPEKTVEHLRRIEKQVQLADNVISALSSFTKQSQPSTQAFSAEDCVRRAIDDTALPPSIEVQVQSAEGLPLALGDEDQIRIVIANLVYNARDAMPQGGILTVTLSHVDGHVQFQISDTGHGIPAEILNQVMEPFFTTKARGIGLGLAISRSIVERNRGLLSVTSSPGSGAAFQLRLPAAPETSTPAAKDR